jgi:hypothetical protein
MVDRIATVLVGEPIPPERIVGMERVPTELPVRGSFAEWLGLLGGFARRSRSLAALPSFEQIQRAYGMRPEPLP